MDLNAVISVTNSFKTGDFVLKEIYLKLMYDTPLSQVLNVEVVRQIQAYYNYHLKDTVWAGHSFLEYMDIIESRTF